MQWKLSFEVAPAGDRRSPTYLRIADAVIDGVRHGRVRPGDRLPSTRQLAEELGVHRNTVKAAFAELSAQGWLETRPASGTFVASDLPERFPQRLAPRRAPRPDAVGFHAPPIELPAADVRSHLAGVPLTFTGIDARLLPRAALARAYRRAVLSSGGAALGYLVDRGHPRLVAAIRTMLASARGIPSERGILVTRGSQMALDLVVRALVRPGDVVAVEEPGYAFGWPAFRLAGARLSPVRVDAHGLVVADLARLVERQPIRAVFVTPHMQYPTGVALGAARRLELLDLARRARFAVIEDDWVHEVRYEGRPILPLASADPAGVTLYLGSFSKVFAPSLRIGYVVGPEPFIARLTRLRALVDVCGDGALELALAELLEDGDVQRHVRRLARVFRRRRDVLMTELDRRLRGVVRFERPNGGSTLWVEVDPSVDVEDWASRARERGVGFLTGRHFRLDGRSTNHLWLGFSGLDGPGLVEAVRRMASAVPRA